MANRVDNCCLLLTNHKQIPTHEPHCSPCNIMPSRGPHVNFCPSFQRLSTNRHADSSAKFVCASQQAEHRPPWSAEPWTLSTQHSYLCIIGTYRWLNNRHQWGGGRVVATRTLCACATLFYFPKHKHNTLDANISEPELSRRKRGKEEQGWRGQEGIQRRIGFFPYALSLGGLPSLP
jgi:hypothetical protein